jgi:biotin synthase
MDIQKVRDLYLKNFSLLVEEAHQIHNNNFSGNKIQASALLSIKTGGCPENCSYCSQSAHYKTGVNSSKMVDLSFVIEEAKKAKDNGATRFCMGAAWREVRDGGEFDRVLEFVRAVKSMDMQVCCTLGMLTKEQADRLKEAGLFAYNHNLDTSKEYYKKIVQTRTYEDRLRTIDNVRKAGLTVCTGGILGLGESQEDRIHFIHEISSLTPSPESITVNSLAAMKGTPLENEKRITDFEMIRAIATLRILNPQSQIRLSAGRGEMSSISQFLCFYVGANSLFLGEKLLTSPNPIVNTDKELLLECGYSF